jgi:MinD superfamily P-loop ATPase
MKYNKLKIPIGCGTCMKVCPVHNFELQNHKPVFKHQCEQCYGCINLCPIKAIGYAKMKLSRYKHPYITVKQLIGS